MKLFATAMAIFGKDLRLELRTREIVSTTALFSLLITVLSAFAFDLHHLKGVTAAAGVMWISICFSGVLAIGRTWLRERENNVWTGVLLSPASRGGLYLGKMLGLGLFLLIVEFLLAPISALFFHVEVMRNLHLLAAIFLVGTLGFSAVGTLFGAMTIRTGTRDLLLGIILFPLVSPTLILSVKATAAVLSGQGLTEILGYLKFGLALDILFISLGLWLFGFLMED